MKFKIAGWKIRHKNPKLLILVYICRYLSLKPDSYELENTCIPLWEGQYYTFNFVHCIICSIIYQYFPAFRLPGLVYPDFRLQIFYFFEFDYPYRNVGGSYQSCDYAFSHPKAPDQLLAVCSMDSMRGIGYVSLLLAVHQVYSQRGDEPRFYGNIPAMHH